MPTPRIRLRKSRDLWILRLVAILIAFILWAAIHGGKRLEITKKISVDYILPDQVVLASVVPREVTVKVAGPGAFIEELRQKNLNVMIDLREYEPDNQENIVELNSKVLKIPFALNVESVEPRSVSFRLDYLDSKRVAVQAVFSGQLPDGFKVKNVTLDPSTVMVKGARQRLKKIESVPSESITLSSNSLKQEYDVSVDVSAITGLQIEENQRTVHVIAELDGKISSRWIKKIPLGLRLSSAVGRGAKLRVSARTNRISLIPAYVNVLIEGPQEVIRKVSLQEIEFWAEVSTLEKGLYLSPLSWKVPPQIRVVKRSVDQIKVLVP